MAQTLFTSQVPVSPDLSDNTVYSLGTYFTPAVDGTVTHVRWWFPTTPQPGGVPIKGALFRTSDGVKISDPVDAVFASPGTLNDWNEVALSPPVHITAGVTYCAAIRTPGRYPNSGGGATPWPITNGDLSTGAQAGRFTDMGSPGGADVVFPTTNFNDGAYFVDLVFEPDGGTPAEGTSDVGLDLAVAATGGAAAEGAAAVGLGLAVAAAGSADAEGSAALGIGLAVSASGTSRAQGAVTLTLGLAPAAAGERTSLGAVTVGLGLAVAAAGERAARGSAALGLNLAVASSGADGRAGCPVAPWPWTPRVAAGFPWTARPVKSFPEGECS